MVGSGWERELGTPWNLSTKQHRGRAADAGDLPGHSAQAQVRQLAPPFSDDSVLTVLVAPPAGAGGGLAPSLPDPLRAPEVPTSAGWHMCLSALDTCAGFRSGSQPSAGASGAKIEMQTWNWMWGVVPACGPSLLQAPPPQGLTCIRGAWESALPLNRQVAEGKRNGRCSGSGNIWGGGRQHGAGRRKGGHQGQRSIRKP